MKNAKARGKNNHFKYGFSALLVLTAFALISGPRALPDRGIAGFFRLNDPRPAGRNPLLHDVIYRGEDVAQEPLDHYPRFLVLIESVTFSGQTSYCTGTALAPDVVLTAGHCVVNSESINVKVITGTSPLEFHTIPAAKWVHHPDYNGGRTGAMLGEFTEETAHEYKDLGLIVLQTPSSDVEPVTLAPPAFDPGAASSWIFVFGPDRDSKYRITGKLSFAEVEKPRSLGKSKLYVAPLKAGQGWCVRDSGGPVTVAAQSPQGVRQHYLLGVAFAFFDGFREGDTKDLAQVWGDLRKVPGCGARLGFTLIGSEIPWIQKTLEELLPGQPRALQIY